MALATQREVDAIVARVRELVNHYGGASSEIAALRIYYEMVERCPENGALVVL